MPERFNGSHDRHRDGTRDRSDRDRWIPTASERKLPVPAATLAAVAAQFPTGNSRDYHCVDIEGRSILRLLFKDRHYDRHGAIDLVQLFERHSIHD